jgi:transcriptional regulator with XRE-family HTH domain
MGNRLRELRTAKGWTQDKAAEAMGVSRGQYIKLERGERRLTNQYIAAAAQAYEVSEIDVIATRKTVPVVGYVAAGSTAHFYDDGGQEPVPMPPGGNDNTVAVEARGDSLGEFFNQWLVYYDDIHDPPTLSMIGHLCVMRLIDGRTVVKKLMRGTRPGLYRLDSQTESPLEDQEIIWAARVTAMTPR